MLVWVLYLCALYNNNSGIDAISNVTGTSECYSDTALSFRNSWPLEYSSHLHSISKSVGFAKTVGYLESSCL